MKANTSLKRTRRILSSTPPVLTSFSTDSSTAANCRGTLSPTDVATFHVFDIDRSTRFRPIMRFAPQQGLSVALSQYAPGKQVWISGKCYTSSAIYSVDPNDRFAAWDSKRIYMECDICGLANTYPIGQAQRQETRDCPLAAGRRLSGQDATGCVRRASRTPVDTEEVTSPDDIPETSYATRAKLTMDTPDDADAWTVVNERLRVLPSRRHLLVSNTGPKKDGYTYCTKCGRIEATAAHSHELHGTHLKPYPTTTTNAIAMELTRRAISCWAPISSPTSPYFPCASTHR